MSRASMGRLGLTLLAAAVLAGASGCKNSCRLLSEKLCLCNTTSAEQDACNQNVANEDGTVQPSADAQVLCQQLYSNCDCHLVNTPQGKVICGLARDAGQPD